MMDINSKHLLTELFGCDSEILKNKSKIEALLIEAALAADVTVVKSSFHRYLPQGVTGVVIIEESHLSIHTWPEYNYASVDFYTCGTGSPEKALEVIKLGLKTERIELILIDRGKSLNHKAMSIRYHKKLKVKDY